MSKTKEIAGNLNGLEYGDRLPRYIIEDAIRNGVVIVRGASDDLMEFDGAVRDEVDCYDGGTAFFNSQGLVKSKCADDDCPYFLAEKQKGAPIEALWCKEPDYSWTYKTEIPHETFEMVEYGEPYCRGIVFKLSDVRCKLDIEERD